MEESRLLSQFNALDDKERSKVEHHLRVAGKIQDWSDINHHLIEQFHENKFLKKQRGSGYYTQDENTKKFYSNYVFWGKRQHGTFSPFPCEYKCYLEDVMYSQVANATTNDFDCLAVYYNHQDKPEQLKFSEFHADEWNLSKGSAMTEEDLQVMKKYRKGFLSFLDSCLEELKHGKKDGFRKCKNARNAIAKAMGRIVETDDNSVSEDKEKVSKKRKIAK